MISLERYTMTCVVLRHDGEKGVCNRDSITDGK